MMQFAHRPKLKWNPLNERRRRVWCGLCRYDCGGLFDVPDDVWLHYVGEEQRHEVLCIGCWHWLVDAIDGGALEAAHGVPVPMWSNEFRRRRKIPSDYPTPGWLPAWFSVGEWECRQQLRRERGT